MATENPQSQSSKSAEGGVIREKKRHTYKIRKRKSVTRKRHRDDEETDREGVKREREGWRMEEKKKKKRERRRGRKRAEKKRNEQKKIPRMSSDFPAKPLWGGWRDLPGGSTLCTV